jgi:hypothetical protein
MAQYGLPDGDVSKPGYSERTGNGDGNAFDELDEGFGAGRGSGSGPDGATTDWQSGNNPDGSSSWIEVDLSNIVEPNVHTGHILRAHVGTSGGTRQMDLTVRLKQGTATLGAAIIQFNIPSAYAVYIDNMTELEADQITDYSQLRMRFHPSTTGGGSPNVAFVSALEMEIPDVVPPSPPPMQNFIQSTRQYR